MTNEDILSIARSENPAPIEDCCHHFTRQELITFARRIQQMERERCISIAKKYVEFHMDWDNAGILEAAIREQT